MQVILEVIKGTQEGERFVFDRHESFVVGRKKNKRVQFRIPGDPYLSRYHMLIEVNPPHCLIRDLGSTNGTRINGEKVRDARLKDGDTIRGGRTEIRVRIDSTAAADSTPVGDPPARKEHASKPDLAPHDPWDTKVFGLVSNGAAAELRCSICNKMAEDTLVGDLTETRMLAYVCQDCRRANHDPRYPIPNYEKLKVLGQGMMGPVYKARRVSSDKLVVLKVISRNLTETPEAVKLFVRQMLLAADLKHPRIVPVVEMGQAGDELWLAAEYIDGVDARELARRQAGKLPLPVAVDVTCQVLDALDYAHGRNLVHRDVKPSNILVTGENGEHQAFLADFGLMRNMDEAGVSGITREGEVRGTVPFMPPEQVLDCRFVRPAGDIFAAGATLYWFLTGQFIHDFDVFDARGEKKDPYMIILDDPIIPIRQCDPSILEPVAKVIETALAAEPEDRFETAVEMARALRKAIT